MESKKQLLIVGEQDDLFAKAFLEYVLGEDITCQQCVVEEFSRKITLGYNETGVYVYPECALLLRPVREIKTASSEEERFCWSEQFASVWAAASLSASPVVNRPNEWGWGCRAAFSAALTEQRLTGEVLCPEAFWYKSLPDKVTEMLHQDLSTWQIVDNPQEVLFVRSRLFPKCQGWDQVIVVDEEGFRVTAVELSLWDLEGNSIRVVKELGLLFATVSWGIPMDGTKPVLARINPFPTLPECAPVLREVFVALLRMLCP